jgi:hypothetical protein
MMSDPMHIDHQSRVDQHLRQSNLTTKRQHAGLVTERMRHTTNSAPDHCSAVFASSLCFGSSLTEQCNLHLARSQIQGSPSMTHQRAHRAYLEGTWLALSMFKASYEAVCFVTRFNLHLLGPLALHRRRCTMFVYLPRNASSSRRSGAVIRLRIFDRSLAVILLISHMDKQDGGGSAASDQVSWWQRILLLLSRSGSK